MTDATSNTDPVHGAGWTVTGQTEAQDMGPTGAFTDGVRVSFLTQHGVAGSVFIANNQYTPERVKALITSRATQLDQVSLLSADS